ncbi:hypothetical protein [Streptomyces albicerus]|uniref:hypothetical protein n=1 Tax=Streptomyces albicerus TaxID=2569859 RepID=UPI00124B691B|nr:hypothetical protein [Streptomyces albicerus]
MSGFAGVEALESVPDAWHWSPIPGLDFAAALSRDRRHLFQINARDSYDAPLVHAILAAARESDAQILSSDALLRAIPEFNHPGRRFEVLAAARPGVHRYHEVQHPELQQVTWAIFPGYECEFASPARYSPEDARESFIRFLTPADLGREAVPFLRIRYDNTVTKGGTDGPDGVLAKPETLFRELKLLDGAPGSFVEFENFRGQVFRVEWKGFWELSEVSAGKGPRRISLDELLGFTENSLRT